VGNVLPARKDIMTKLYLAWHPIVTDILKENGTEDLDILGSYFFLKQQPEEFKKLFPNKSFFLDSGAFTADSTGENIDLNNYIKFIKKHKDSIKTYANLDVIGDAEETYQNQKKMEDQNLNPIPTFHYKTPFKYLEKYVNEGYKKYALGGLVGVNRKDKMPWIKRCFNKIPNNLEVHGYGITSPSIVEKFPFHSVDSSSWMCGGRFGIVYQYNRGKIKETDLNFKNNTKTNKKIHKWNLIQWKKYADYLQEEKI